MLMMYMEKIMSVWYGKGRDLPFPVGFLPSDRMSILGKGFIQFLAHSVKTVSEFHQALSIHLTESIATVTASFLHSYLVQTNISSGSPKSHQDLNLFQQQKVINPLHSPTPLLHVFTADISPKGF